MALLDGGRYVTPVPEWGFLRFGPDKVQPDYAMKYYTKDDSSYKLNEFFYDENDGEEKEARRRLFEVVLLFEDAVEKEEFLKYIHENKEEFFEKLKIKPTDKLIQHLESTFYDRASGVLNFYTDMDESQQGVAEAINETEYPGQLDTSKLKN